MNSLRPFLPLDHHPQGDLLRRALLVLFALVLGALPVAAQEPSPERFFIERIEVRNAKRVSADVVIAESRLREGREYTEADLRDASTRLSRLPFLLSVDFSLEKGSERGRHVLVLTISEAKPFFYALDLRPFFDGGDYVEIDYNDRLERGDFENVLGFRWFVGRRGAVHVGLEGNSHTPTTSFDPEWASITAGYTQYDLFGTRAFATLNLKRPFEGYGGGAITPELVVGVPLSPNQTLTLQFEQMRSESDRRIADQTFPRRYGYRAASARWTYNTTNSPFVPTSGTILTFKPIYGQNDSTSFSSFVDGNGEWHVDSVVHHASILTFESGAEHYWELSDRDSISGGVEAGWSRSEVRATLLGSSLPETSIEGHFGTLRAGYTHSLWDRGQRRDGDSLIQLTASFTNRSTEDDYYRYERDARQVSASWVRRSSWGTLRLGAGYAW